MSEPAPVHHHVRDLAPGRAALVVGPDGAPRSAAFEDIYYSPDGGLAESEAVFLAGCGLPEAWAGRADFVVGELGFGAGLNVVALTRAWARARPAGGRLHIVSIEGFPLAREDAARALAGFPEAGEQARALLAAWPPRIKGMHRRVLPDGVFLTLAYLPVAEALAALDLAADAWLLDGFAPARNPDMWSPEVCAGLARLSKPGARAASFTVAGAVRRGLEAAGFEVAKKPGHGAKRERLEAVFRGPAPAPAASPLTPRVPAPAGPVLVLGAGIAGACTAQALRRRGVEVCVLDAGEGPGAGASGMAAGLVAPRLDLDDRPAARLHRSAYAHALAAYAGSPAFRATGIERAGKDAAESARLARALAAEALPPDMAEPVRIESTGAAGMLLRQAGVLDPRGFIEEALAGATTRWGAPVARLERAGETWIARAADGRALAEAVACVLAVGPGLQRLAQTAELEIRPSRGQVTVARLDGTPPARALLWGGYLAPTPDGRVLFGATHDDADADARCTPRREDDARNLAALAAFAPELAERIDGGSLAGRAGLRATTPDRLPYTGAAPDAPGYRERFKSLATGRREDGRPEPVLSGPMLSGLYVLGGLGSRGLVWAPALSEAIASEMLGEPGPLELGAAAALHPARVLARALKRGEG